MRLVHWTLSLLLLTVLGCSELILRDYDSTADTTGKVVTRVLMGLPTLGISEIAIAQAKQDEQRAVDQERYDGWFRSLSHEDQQRELDRDTYRRGMAMQALGLGLMGGGPMRYTPHHQAPLMQAPITCWSVPAGQTVTTQCR